MPSAIYIDNCCSLRSSYARVFPGVPILLDPFHWFDRWDQAISLSADHPLCSIFHGHLRDALLVPDPTDYAREQANNAAARADGKRGKTKTQMKLACRRTIASPAVARPAICAVLDEWRERDRGIARALANEALDGTSAPRCKPFFFNAKFNDVFRREMRHVCNDLGDSLDAIAKHTSLKAKHDDARYRGPTLPPLGSRPNLHTCTAACCACGCLSDPPDVQLSYTKARSKPGAPLYFTARGSNKNEIMHRLLKDSISATSCGVVRAEHFVGSFVYRYNTNRGIDKLGIRDYHTYHHEVLALINSNCASLGAPLHFPDLKLSTHKPEEKIGFECQSLKVVKDNVGDGVCDDPLDEYSTCRGESGDLGAAPRVVSIRKDGHSLCRAVTHACGDSLEGIEPRHGSGEATMAFLAARRRAAATHLRDHRSQLDLCEAAEIDAYLEPHHASFDVWFDDMMANDSSSSRRWWELLLFIAMALMLDTHSYYTIARSVQRQCRL